MASEEDLCGDQRICHGVSHGGVTQERPTPLGIGLENTGDEAADPLLVERRKQQGRTQDGQPAPLLVRHSIEVRPDDAAQQKAAERKLFDDGNEPDRCQRSGDFVERFEAHRDRA